MTPDGRFFTHLNADHAKHYVAFSGGSGITPVLAIIKTTLETEPTSRFTLVYGNRSVDAIMFAEELEDLKNRFMSRFSLYHVLSDDLQDVELFNGVLDQEKCAAFLQTLAPAAEIDEAFICGPGPMMDAAEAALKDAGVPPKQVHVERFGTPLPQAGVPAIEITDDTPAADLELIIDGKKRKLRLPYVGVSVLDVGLKAGLALPYACKGGVCCTCRAKVLEGEVKMEKNYTLEQHEIDDGFVLTCQCHPVSDRVVVSYDERYAARRIRLAYTKGRSLRAVPVCLPAISSPMSIIHVTNGDHAAEPFAKPCKLAERDERVIALKDDLAVGPLKDVDDAPDTRATFWRHVLNARRHRLRGRVRGSRKRCCASLVRGDAQIVDLARPERVGSTGVAARRLSSAQCAAAPERSKLIGTRPAHRHRCRRQRSTAAAARTARRPSACSRPRNCSRNCRAPRRFRCCASAGSRSNGRKRST